MTKIVRNKWTEEELKVIKDNYYLGIDIVSKLIKNRTVQSIKKKASRLSLNVIKDNIYHNLEIIENAVSDSISFAEVFRKLNKSKSGDSYKVIKSYIIRNNIDISHFDPWGNNKSKSKKNISEYLKIGTNITSSHLKQRLYTEGLMKRICEKCGQTENWNNERISLILDHINGINNDNRLENLRILCPNCNATLDTHCVGNTRNQKSRKTVI